MTPDQAYSIATQASGLEHFRQSAPLTAELRETAQLQMALMAQQGASVKQLARDIDTAYGPVEQKAALCDEALAACEAALKVLPGLEVHSWPPGFRLKREAIERLSAVLAKARVEASNV